tara:strand:- start:1070 stop:1540 length:471 start_codon:yes stop_codon:yes gene_type:complete
MPYTDPEARRAYGRRWRAANRERELAAARARYAANREARRARQLVYYAANRERDQRSARLRDWERHNVNPWPYASREELHDLRYAVATHCEYCGPRWGSFATLELTSRINPRRMEHDHRPPFLFRAISCNRCNTCRGHWDRRILAVHEELAHVLDI